MSDYVVCDCCGAWTLDTKEENRDFDTRYLENGRGMCIKCGGDPRTDKMTDADLAKLPDEEYWRLMGSAHEMFFSTRVKLLSETLKDQQLERFQEMSLPLKVKVISKLIQKGVMI